MAPSEEQEQPALAYLISRAFFSTALDVFFREITSRGSHRIPATGPVIFVCAPHANQFVDPLVLIKHAGRQNVKPRDAFLVGGASLEITEVISDTEVKIKGPVTTPKALTALISTEGEGSKGTAYKLIPHVDQSEMFATVISRLASGGCVGIFPEGGSHDRSEFLPLKPGVAMMALGAMSQHDSLNVKIVPCGLNYFHAHKFRSRAVIEFGEPIEVDRELVSKYRQGGMERRNAVGDLLNTIYKGLKSVAVTAPDYDTLMGFYKFRSQPAVQDLFIRVQEYNKLLKYYGIKDHQVMKTSFGGVKALVLLASRVTELVVLFLLAAPGTDLAARVNALVDELGPALFEGGREEFEASRIVRPEDISYSEYLATRMNKYGRSAGDDFMRWECVDSSEVEDDVFLFKDVTGELRGARRDRRFE
ncbi:hypothetical protein HDU96_005611 [Phlyctochytrium bullatum]|nr:hypothetical protein HDU96_005611 [Phlyctochytrium bullatum]